MSDDDMQQKLREQTLTQGIMILALLASFSFMFGKLEGFSCETKELLTASAYARHLFGLSGLFAVLVIFTRANPIVSPPALVGVTFAMYAVFLVVCRCDVRFLAVVLGAVVLVLYLEAERCWLHKENGEVSLERQELIARAQLWLEVGVLIVAVLGCIVYIGQHAREYAGEKWVWSTFWLGVPACKGNGSPCDVRGSCSITRDMYDGMRKILMRDFIPQTLTKGGRLPPGPPLNN